MLTNDQLQKYAEVLFWGLETARKNRFKKNDIIGITISGNNLICST